MHHQSKNTKNLPTSDTRTSAPLLNPHTKKTTLLNSYNPAIRQQKIKDALTILSVRHCSNL